ncbi:Hypothetical_protein [Hexamita inflata]|uniref:Hypothetical_protein n=1 Tax=Hexamita inflata TaxID=28002 RepID=A0AA86TTH7_9EUKA|nr:Hypothetical protein HINF_LOCUS9243 [Hexamita inflata]CAI9950257.1 Hypothetical protein HINF_LOCUS37902 [Hexamita inflata]
MDNLITEIAQLNNSTHCRQLVISCYFLDNNISQQLCDNAVRDIWQERNVVGFLVIIGLERKGDDQRKRVTSIDVIYGAMAFILFSFYELYTLNIKIQLFTLSDTIDTFNQQMAAVAWPHRSSRWTLLVQIYEMQFIIYDVYRCVMIELKLEKLCIRDFIVCLLISF